MRTGDWIGGARILGTAGRGAMGVVYRAHQESLDRLVAVKVVASDLAADPEFRARFQREARSAAALNHPHSVGVYDAGEDQGRLYLTMQYVDGRDLATMLREHGPMPPADAVVVIGQIASALDAAHERRMVHRDVKPANIMVTRVASGWHAYLTDFGITTQIGQAGLTRTGMAVGTLDFMAPEQLVGDPYDHRADVYALGAVLYQALTGRVPFPRDTDPARIYAHLNADVPDVSTAVSGSASPAVGTALSAVVRRALAKQPAARFESAGALAEAARSALRGEGSTRAPKSKAYTPTGDASSRSRRPGRRALLLGGAGVVVAAAAGAAVAIPRLTADDGAAPSSSGTPAPRLGLPDDVPAAKPDPRVTEEYRVGSKPSALEVANDIAWVNNRGDGTMTRINLISGTTKGIRVGGTPHEFVMVADRVWVAVIGDSEVYIQAIDVGTGGLTGKRITLPLTGAGLFRSTPDGKFAWLSYNNTLVRIDLQKGTVVKKVTVGQQIVAVSLSPRALLVLDQASHQLYRLDPETGEESESPLTVPREFRGTLQVDGKTYIGGGLIGYGELLGDAVPKGDDLHLKNFSIGMDEAGAWGIDVTTSEFRRLKPDLTGTIGAPVTDLHASDSVAFDITSTRLSVLDPSERTVRIFAVTPLRKD